jgi:hypothetical protein
MIPKGRPPLLPGIIPDKSVTANRAYRNASNAPINGGYSAPPVNAIHAEQHPQMLVTSTKMTLNGGGGGR